MRVRRDEHTLLNSLAVDEDCEIGVSVASKRKQNFACHKTMEFYARSGKITGDAILKSGHSVAEKLKSVKGIHNAVFSINQ